jgi:urease alpha subunit
MLAGRPAFGEAGNSLAQTSLTFLSAMGCQKNLMKEVSIDGVFNT